MVIDLRGSSQ